jgi:uncharacterized protein YbjT (DUF2867 family)
MSCIATLIGASGLIGSNLLKILLEDPCYSLVKIAVRKKTEIHHPKLQEYIIDFSDEAAIGKTIAGSTVIFCSEGTTKSKVKGDNTAYRRVDYDIPVAAAIAANQHRVPRFILVSAVGAYAKSNNFYLQLKGEVEDKITGMQFIKSKYMMQPSLLLGSRSEKRPGEKIGQLLMPLFSFLLMGSLKKYRPVRAIDVAKAMLVAGKNEREGLYKCTYSEIIQMSENVEFGTGNLPTGQAGKEF